MRQGGVKSGKWILFTKWRPTLSKGGIGGINSIWVFRSRNHGLATVAGYGNWKCFWLTHADWSGGAAFPLFIFSCLLLTLSGAVWCFLRSSL